jgi:hypothetical protein
MKRGKKDIYVLDILLDCLDTTNMKRNQTKIARILLKQNNNKNINEPKMTSHKIAKLIDSSLQEIEFLPRLKVVTSR